MYASRMPRKSTHTCVYWWPKSGAKLRCRSEEHTSELQSRLHLVCRLLLEKKKKAARPSLKAKASPTVSDSSSTGFGRRRGRAVYAKTHLLHQARGALSRRRMQQAHYSMTQ